MKKTTGGFAVSHMAESNAELVTTNPSEEMWRPN